MIYTTLNKIRSHAPCAESWQKLLTSLGKTAPDDEPLPLVSVLDSNGLHDCIWCLRTVPEHDRKWRLYAVWHARRVQHLLTDPRSIAAIDVAERHANGDASDKELAAAGSAAWSAAEAAWSAAGAAAWSAAGSEARAAAWTAAWPAAWSAWSAARSAARSAAGSAAGAAWSAAEAAGSEARAAAWTAAELKLREVLTTCSKWWRFGHA